MGSAGRALFLVARFAIEIVMLVAVWHGGYALPGPIGLRAVFALAAVAAVALVWALFVSPKARFQLPESGRLAVELCVVAAAVIALRSRGRVLPALLLAAAAVTSALINSFLLRNRPHTPA